MMRDAPIDRLEARAYRIPTDSPEADGTFAWNATTIVIVHVHGGGATGLGYTYADACLVRLIETTLFEVIKGLSAFSPDQAWTSLQRAVRNLGRQGLVAAAISAIDAALWDLKARLLGLPLVELLGARRSRARVYGSGGFTTYTDAQLREQLSEWVDRDGCLDVKIKVGTHPDDDPRRIAVARSAIGNAGLFIDANGAFDAKQAVGLAESVSDEGVSWFEEPVTSDDLASLAFVREKVPGAMEIAAGEYGYDIDYFDHMLAAQSVDCQQADLTRCGGITGFLQVATLCEAHHTDLSAHCAPSLHLHACCAAQRFRHLEWFHDHVRIEQMLFEGAPRVRAGFIEPELSRPGHGLELRRTVAERYAV